MSTSLTSFKESLKRFKSISNDFPTNIKIAVGGNCSVQFMLPSIQVILAENNIGCEVIELDYNNWITSALSDEVQADLWVIWHSSMGFTKGGTERPQIDFNSIEMASKRLIESGRKVLMILPEALETEFDQFSDFVPWRKEVKKKLEDSFENSIIRFDPDAIIRYLGNKMWYASRFWSMAKSPCHIDAQAILGEEIGKIISQIIRPKIKAVIVDLDDTLWGGVIGDDGLHGIKLDPHGEGRPFLELQRFLKDLIRKGIPISVVSKNEEKNAKEPFLKHQDMILTLEDIVYFEASWEPKYLAIEKIISNLNLDASAVCFIDDSDFERDNAKAFIPNLYIPALPVNPDERTKALYSSGHFYSPITRDDDLLRVKRYQNEAERQKEKSIITDLGNYFESLKMEIEPVPISIENISRVTSLVLKTNQFNLTNKRHQADEILSIVNNKENYTCCFSLKDRFGDSGLISVLLAKGYDDQVEIDTWVMSCRVFSRGVEDAILESFLKWVGDRSVYGKYISTEKNKLVLNYINELEIDVNKEDGLFSKRNLVNRSHKIRIKE